MQELMNLTGEEMMLVKGIGMVKTKKLSAILRFPRYVQGDLNGNRTII
jgi:DNA repair protein RadC